MKVPAIVLAVVLGAASMSAQALAGYAGATAALGTAASGAAAPLGNGGSGLHNKMAAALGGSSQADQSQAAPAANASQAAPAANAPAAAPAENARVIDVTPKTPATDSSQPADHAGCMRNKMGAMSGDKSDMQGMHSGMHCTRMQAEKQGMSGMHCSRMRAAKSGCHCKEKGANMAKAGGCKHGHCMRKKMAPEKKS